MEGGKDGGEGGGSSAPLDLATSVSTAQVATYTRAINRQFYFRGLGGGL